MCGNVRGASWLAPAEAASPYHLKALVEAIFSRLGISEKEYVMAPESAMGDVFADALTVSTRSGKRLGVLGTVAGSMLQKFDIGRPVMFAELEWDAVLSLARKRSVTYTAVGKTQPVRRDLALLLDVNVTFADVQAVVTASERKLLRGVELFDVYEGKNLPAGKKSYAIAITIQDDERTLQDKQIDAVMTKVIANLRSKLGAELR